MKRELDGADLAAIRALVLAMDGGSLTSAARRLGVTPSAVSRQVTRLEETLGVRLLERSTRSVRGTDAGLALAEKARPLFEAFEDAGASVREADGEVRGRVRITATRGLGRACLLPVVAGLLAEHPRLELSALLDTRRLDFVDDGIDLALREGTLPDSSLTARKLGEVPVHLFAAPAYLGKRGRPSSLDDLVDHDLLAVPASSPATDLSTVRGRGGRRLGLVAKVLVNDVLGLADLAVYGSGIAALPAWAAREACAAGSLVRVLPRVTLATMPVHVVYPGRRHLPRRVEVVLEHLKKTVPPLLR